MKKTILLIFCMIFIQASIAHAQTFRVRSYDRKLSEITVRARDIATEIYYPADTAGMMSL